MKTFIIGIISLLFITSCKEEKKDDPVPVPVIPQVSVKINGTVFSCTSCGNTYSSGGLSGVNFAEGTLNRFIFSISGFLPAGTYTLVPFGNPSFTYEKDGRYYRGRGVLNLTETDTSTNGNIKKFIGTFNCVTDTNAGIFYNFSEGQLNVNFN
jgi:hypothetical protein